jgi:hypothetical protein
VVQDHPALAAMQGPQVTSRSVGRGGASSEQLCIWLRRWGN